MIASEKRPHTIPVSVRRCPIHNAIVAVDGEGRLLGKCAGCAGEAADGIIALRRNARGV